MYSNRGLSEYRYLSRRQGGQLELDLSVGGYGRILIAAMLILVGSHLVLNYTTHEIREVPWIILQLFELDEENNLPTWFSSFLLLNNALILSLMAANFESFKTRWVVLAAGFWLLTIDEVAGLHESVNTVTEINWAIPALVLVSILGVWFIPFLLSLPRRQMIAYVVSGSIFVGGAIGVELFAEDMEEETWPYALAVAVEEGMEMLGAIIFLLVNLNLLKGKEIALRWGD